jgi:phosphosulfolactate synthase
MTTAVQTDATTNGGRNKPLSSWGYLRLIGVPDIPPRTSPFDPGYDPATLESHLEQSSHLISVLKISMACWQVANETATRRKVQAARRLNVPVCTGGGPFEIAATFGTLPEFLDLCADIGVTRIEAGEGFTDQTLDPREIIRLAEERGLDVQFEVGKKHGGTFTDDVVGELIDQGMRWLDAGAKKIVVEGRESAQNVGLFDMKGNLNTVFAERFVSAYGVDNAIFEAPNKPSQFALLNHFGPVVHLSNVRIEELLRVEIYRRGLHSDAFQHENLRPRGPSVLAAEAQP